MMSSSYFSARDSVGKDDGVHQRFDCIQFTHVLPSPTNHDSKPHTLRQSGDCISRARNQGEAKHDNVVGLRATNW